MSEKIEVPRALSDDSVDGRYTHQTYLSPGGPGGPKTTGTPYPKWVKDADGQDVIVQDPDEEKAVAKKK